MVLVGIIIVGLVVMDLLSVGIIKVVLVVIITVGIIKVVLVVIITVGIIIVDLVIAVALVIVTASVYLETVDSVSHVLLLPIKTRTCRIVTLTRIAPPEATPRPPKRSRMTAW